MSRASWCCRSITWQRYIFHLMSSSVGSCCGVMGSECRVQLLQCFTCSYRPFQTLSLPHAQPGPASSQPLCSSAVGKRISSILPPPSALPLSPSSSFSSPLPPLLLLILPPPPPPPPLSPYPLSPYPLPLSLTRARRYCKSSNSPSAYASSTARCQSW